MDKIADIAIEPLGCGLYAAHVQYPDGQRRIFVCDDLHTLPASLIKELARVHLTVES